MNARRACMLAAALFIAAGAGCTLLGPDYERPASPLPAAYPGAAASGAAAIQGEWWTLYGDATLNELVASALARNADLRIAAARIEETDANLREAGAAFLPPVDFGFSGSRSEVSTRTAVPVPATAPLVRNNLRMTASTSFELDFWGRLRRNAESARSLALVSRYAREVIRLSLAGLVAQTYFSLRSLDAQIALTGETMKSRMETLDFVRRRARGGLASDLDVNQAELAYRDSSSQLTELRRQRLIAEHQLGLLSGRLDLALPAGTLLALPLPPVPPAGLPSSLLERRPDVRQAEEQLVAANAQIGIARAAMLPTISLTGSYGAESRALAMLLGGGANIWSAGFGLTLPIFDAGRLQARSDAALARQRQSLGNYQKAAESAYREVADALSNLQQTAAGEGVLQARAAAARSTLRLARIRYEAGYSAYLEVLDAQRTANEAELALLRNRQSRLSATVDLMKALGGGWSDETVRDGIPRIGASSGRP